VIEDCAQAHGAEIDGHLVGGWGDMAAFSFFPTKNLGCLGDGGMVVTSNASLAERLRVIRQYGWNSDRVSVTGGINSRLDELQAALLRAKLDHLDADNQRRRARADIYDSLLSGLPLILPAEPVGFRHVYHQYVVRTTRRDALRRWLAAQRIETGIHYPLPIHRQPAFAAGSLVAGTLERTDSVAEEILSLPIFPQLDAGLVQQVAEAVGEWFDLGQP
jgi:dTDP-4-amino-4,6-dideoxygalactose transaminase